MAKYENFSCPDCGGIFKWMRHPSTDPDPNFCPLCGSQVNPEYVFVPEAPHVARSIGRTADGVYRQMEDASREHMYAAAELTGDDVSDYRAMQITDMPDYLREGDTASAITASANSPVVAAMRGGVGGFQGMTGQEYAASVGQGVFPRAGDQMRQMVAGSHQGTARAIEARGTRARSR